MAPRLFVLMFIKVMPLKNYHIEGSSLLNQTSTTVRGRTVMSLDVTDDMIIQQVMMVIWSTLRTWNLPPFILPPFHAAF